MEGSPAVTLTTMDGEEVQVPLDVISKSVLVKGIVDDAGYEDPIPLQSVKKTTLDKVIEFCRYI